MHLVHSRQFTGKKILLVDREEKIINDRTWCFWETEPGLFEELVYHRWKEVWVHGKEKSEKLSLAPYNYKLIRGIDYYEYCFSTLSKQENVEIRYGNINSIQTWENEASIQLDGETISADYVFNSIQFEKPVLKEDDIFMLQHFKGWVVQTKDPVFDPSTATLMDFRVSQQHGTVFVYVMPFSTTHALVEYTVFSQELLNDEQYIHGLNNYLEETLAINHYRVLSEEFGIIPMTNHRYPVSKGRVIHIGTAGGQTRPSTGYTFRSIQKHSAQIVQRLIEGKFPVVRERASRTRFYDITLLSILSEQKLPGDEIFTRLFFRNPAAKVLKFLDNETSLPEEMLLLSTLQTWPFLKAGVGRLTKGS